MRKRFPESRRILAGRFGDCRWVPWAIAGAFLVIAAVNGGLVYFALASNTGLADDAAYEDGLAYNAVIAEAARQEALGWHVAIAFNAARKGGHVGEVVVDVQDRNGKPISDLDIRGELVRPVEPLPPVTLSLGAEGEGRYAAAIAVPRPGQWNLRLVARRQGELYQTGRRILVP